MRWRVLAVLIEWGCTSGASKHIELTLPQPPVVLEYRAGDAGSWIVPAGKTGNQGQVTYELTADGDLEIIYVCEPSPSQYYLQELLVTSDEWDTVSQDWPYYACPPSLVDGVTVQLSGEMVQAGAIFAGDAEADSNSAQWQYQVPVVPGTIDLIGIDNSRFAIRRNQSVQMDFVEPAIDLATDGMQYSSMGFQISQPLPAETVIVDEHFITANGTLLPLPSSLTTLAALPSQLVIQSDAYAVSVLVYTSTEARGAYGTYTAVVPESISLLPVLSGIMYSGEDVSASWSVLPNPYTTVGFSYQDASNTQTVEASAEWIQEHDVAALSYDPSFPDNSSLYDISLASASHQFGVLVVTGSPDRVVYTCGTMDAGSP